MPRRIAVIGWGSLLWQPGELSIEGDWRLDGPQLPIEFARVSRDGRLTLVIHAGVECVTTYWALSRERNVDMAVMNLACREGTLPKHIGAEPAHTVSALAVKDEAIDRVRAWLAERSDLDAAVWTNLRTQGLPSTSLQSVLEYLRGLDPQTQARAEEYIRRAPAQVRTRFRIAIEREFNWYPMDEPHGC